MPQAFAQTVQQGQAEKWLDPAHVAIAQQVAQRSPAEIRAALPYLIKSHQAESQQLEDSLKQAQTFEATQRGQELQAQIQAGGTPAMQDTRYTNLKAQQAGGAQLSPDDQNFIKGYEARKLLVPQFRVENRQGPQGTLQLIWKTRRAIP